jgi:ankyrin repeat protein
MSRAGLFGAVAAVGMEGHAMASTETRADPKELGPDGLPVIFWKVKSGDMAGVAALLDAGADLESQGYHGATPALAAAVVDDWPMVDFLLQRGANAAASDRRGFTIAWLSAQAKVAPDSATEVSLTAVRKRLNERLLLERVHDPVEVRKLQANGAWPPR